MEMFDYIVLAALVVALVSLIGCIIVCLCCTRLRKEYGRSLVTRIREQDRVTRELERTRVEKQTIEKVLLTKLAVAADPPGAPDASGGLGIADVPGGPDAPGGPGPDDLSGPPDRPGVPCAPGSGPGDLSGGPDASCPADPSGDPGNLSGGPCPIDPSGDSYPHK